MKSLLVTVAVGLSLLGFAGCTENAVFELTLTLAEPQGDYTHALIQVRRSASAEFAMSWGGGDDPAPRALETGGSTFVGSLMTEDENTDIKVKVTFCTDDTCSRLADDPTRSPAWWILLKHPFYEGEYTSYRYPEGGYDPDGPVPSTGIPTGPPSEWFVVGKCYIAGCFGTLSLTGSDPYCNVLDIPEPIHICE